MTIAVYRPSIPDGIDYFTAFASVSNLYGDISLLLRPLTVWYTTLEYSSTSAVGQFSSISLRV